MAIVFALPPEFDAPEGDVFDALATLRLNEDGTVTLEALDGVLLPDDEAAPPPEEVAEDVGFLEGVEGNF